MCIRDRSWALFGSNMGEEYPTTLWGKIKYYGKGFIEGSWDGVKLTANGVTFGALPNDWIDRDALIRQYGNVGRFSEFAGGTATVCLSTAGALKIAGVNPWLGKAGFHPPHHGMGRHFEIILRGNKKIIIPGKDKLIYRNFWPKR